MDLSALDPMLLFWVVATLIFGVTEAVTVNIVSIWFAGGALIAAVAAALGAPLWLQVVLFLVCSAVLLAALRPFVKKYVTPKKNATNADRIIGQTALVTEEINNLQETGAVKISGVLWTAKSQGGEIIPVGTIIKILRIEGAKVWVKPVKTEPVQVELPKQQIPVK